MNITIDKVELENKLLAYKYLYYVHGKRAISDYNYDILEEQAFNILDEESPAFDIGSDSEDDYTQETKDLANSLQLLVDGSYRN